MHFRYMCAHLLLSSNSELRSLVERKYSNFGSPAGAVREGEIGADMGHINDCACGGMFCSIDHKLEADLHLIGNVFTADFILS